MDMLLNEAPYLLTREQAAKRYGLAQRVFDEVYRRDPEFPTLRIGKRVMVHRDKADEYFTRRIGEVIEVG